MANRCLLFFLLPLLCNTLHAQNNVNGKVYSATTDSIIAGATVYNKSLKLAGNTDHDGHYSIAASEGDKLIFSAVGFTPDTVIVQFSMLLTAYDVTLQQKIVTLQMVKVYSSYQLDSINRRNMYADIFKKQPGLTGGNRPSSGFGISVSPLSYFSSAAKRKRDLKKRLLKEERDDYIDRSFPKEWVERLTNLKGDSLNLFMYRFRPSYEYCRKTDREEMLLYINEKLKEFRKPKN